MSQHLVVQAQVSGEQLYSQTHYTSLAALHDAGDLLFHDNEKVVTIFICRCPDADSHSKK